MSDDFGAMDDACWDELDAVAAQAYATLDSTLSSSKHDMGDAACTAPVSALNSIENEKLEHTEDCFDELESIALDDDALDELSRLESATSAHIHIGPFQTSWNKKLTRQTTLFGEVLPLPSTTSANAQTQSMHKTSSEKRDQSVLKASQTKTWDYESFAKTGWMNKNKVTKRSSHNDGEWEDDNSWEDDEYELDQFPNVVIKSPPQSMKLTPDTLSSRKWIYPIDKPKRDYQFNIVRNALFKNCLVALPTGLGKTFIAAVVMLNYYNWFPDGKVVFIAPTKPLVAQQLEACHSICGIPQEQSVVMTGEVSQRIRAQSWLEKRIFFMTPQTLQNDLRLGHCDPTDIVLLVIDEAHRGTGNYAYAQVMRFLMQTNPFFRVLALTATPGNTVDKVQEIVDALHISHIEIRNENSLDIKQYVHKKELNLYIIEPTPAVARVRDAMVAFMEVTHRSLQTLGILPIHNGNYIGLNSYRCLTEMKNPKLRDRPSAYTPLKHMSIFARAMAALLEGSVGMCYRTLKEASEEAPKDNGKRSTEKSEQNRLSSQPLFQKVLQLLDIMHADGPVVHPKMEKIKMLALDHFASAAAEGTNNPLANSQETPVEETKMMIFASFRDYVDQLVDYLNQEQPIIRATRFIGQGVDKRGKKGMLQKEQLEVLKKFKDGHYNILVATSVGEEGLDIGEVESIIFYDTSKDSIRSLQRAGRTGRKKKGKVHVLMAQGREEGNWSKAQDAYRGVQEIISKGTQIELYSDVPTLLSDTRPTLVQMTMDAQPYILEDARLKEQSLRSGKGTKRKRSGDPSRNIPPGATTGFVKAKDLTVKLKAKRQKLASGLSAALDDSDDEAIMNGLAFKRRKTEENRASNGDNKSSIRRLRQSKTYPGPISSSDDSDHNSHNNVTTKRLHASGMLRVVTSPKNPLVNIGGISSKIKNDRKENQSKRGMNSPDSCSIPNSPSYLRNPPLQENSSDKSWHTKSAHDVELSPVSTPTSHNKRLALDSIISINSDPDRENVSIYFPECLVSPLSATQDVRLPARRTKRNPPPINIESPSPSSRQVLGSPALPIDGGQTMSSPSRIVEDEGSRLLIDVEAIHSGSETSKGVSDSDLEEDELDLQFTTSLPETQLSPSYPQTQVYRQSIFTQQSREPMDVAFRNCPSKYPAYVTRETNRRRPGVSSSPPRSPESDNYEFNSFLVADDEF